MNLAAAVTSSGGSSGALDGHTVAALNARIAQLEKSNAESNARIGDLQQRNQELIRKLTLSTTKV